MFKNLNNTQKIFVFIFVISVLGDLLNVGQGGYNIFGSYFEWFGMPYHTAENVGLMVYVCCIIGFFLFKTKNKTQD